MPLLKFPSSRVVPIMMGSLLNLPVRIRSISCSGITVPSTMGLVIKGLVSLAVPAKASILAAGRGRRHFAISPDGQPAAAGDFFPFFLAMGFGKKRG